MVQDSTAVDAQQLEHANEHVAVPLSTAHGAKLQLTTAIRISTPYGAKHCQELYILRLCYKTLKCKT
jgi:hypothetical protein